MERGATASMTSEEGKTASAYAAENGHEVIASYLEFHDVQVRHTVTNTDLGLSLCVTNIIPPIPIVARARCMGIVHELSSIYPSPKQPWHIPDHQSANLQGRVRYLGVNCARIPPENF